MTVVSKIDVKLKQYEQTVVDYVRKESGYFLVATNDTTFASVLRNTIQKQLAVTEDCISTITDESEILKVIREVSFRKKRILIFLERVFNNKDTAFMVKQVKNAYKGAKIIILTGETEKQRLVLLHEIGADNFISKPISINTLIEKIAFTIKPQGKIGKLIDMGKAMVANKQYEQAYKAGLKILELKPNSAAALLILGDAARGMGKKVKAVEAYEEASQHAPMYLEPLKKLADFYEAEGDKEMQLKYLERLDSLSPLHVERKVDMGEIHMEMGNDERAEALFDGAVTQAKKEALSYIGEITTKIGNVYAKKDPEKAEKFYRQALEAKGNMLDKSDIRTFNNLGLALRKQGKWEEAIAEYKKAQRITPDDENVHYNIAMAYAEGKEFPRAIEHLTKALDINNKFFSHDAVIAHNIGLIFFRAGRRSNARQFLEYALKINPEAQNTKRLLEEL